MVTDERFSWMLVMLVVLAAVLLVRGGASFILTLVVRDSPRTAGDCGSLVEVVRFKLESGGALLVSAVPVAPVSAASASARASLLRDASFPCDRTEAARPRPPIPWTDVGLPSLEGGGIVVLSASSLCIGGASRIESGRSTELVLLLSSGMSSSGITCSPDVFRANCGNKLLLFACLDVVPSSWLGTSRLRFSIGP